MKVVSTKRWWQQLQSSCELQKVKEDELLNESTDSAWCHQRTSWEELSPARPKN